MRLLKFDGKVPGPLLLFCMFASGGDFSLFGQNGPLFIPSFLALGTEIESDWEVWSEMLDRSPGPDGLRIRAFHPHPLMRPCNPWILRLRAGRLFTPAFWRDLAVRCAYAEATECVSSLSVWHEDCYRDLERRPGPRPSFLFQCDSPWDEPWSGCEAKAPKESSKKQSVTADSCIGGVEAGYKV
jgi:hypothetical protein